MHTITIDTLTIALQSTGHTVEWPVTGHLILDGTVIERRVYQDIVRCADDVKHAVELLAEVAMVGAPDPHYAQQTRCLANEGGE